MAHVPGDMYGRINVPGEEGLGTAALDAWHLSHHVVHVSARV